MNELHFAYRVRQQLNRGLQDIPADVDARLLAARQKALASQKVAVAMHAPAALTNEGLNFSFSLSPAKQMLVALAVLAGTAATTLTVADHKIRAIGHLDSALLSDDLPVRAFTDKGFALWLKQSSED